MALDRRCLCTSFKVVEEDGIELSVVLRLALVICCGVMGYLGDSGPPCFSKDRMVCRCAVIPVIRID